MGDFNAKIESQKKRKEDADKGGRELIKLTQNNKLIIANKLEIT